MLTRRYEQRPRPGSVRRQPAGAVVRFAIVAMALGVWGSPEASGQTPSSASPLRFVTLNVLHGGPLSGWTGKDAHLEARLDLVTEALLALAPDVIALQEASQSSARGDVASRLAGRLGLNYVYTPSSMQLFDTGLFNRAATAFMDFSEGPAILSRFPIVRSETLRLPRCGRWLDPRVLLFVELATPQGPIPVFSAHTSGHVCHAQAVGVLVRERRRDLPSVLMGDLNAVESSPAMAALASEVAFVDTFRTVHPDAPGFTVYQPVTAPARRVRRRVDYVLLVPGRSFPGAVVDSRVVVDVPGRLVDGTVLWPSDHFGVMADLSMFPAPEAGVASPIAPPRDPFWPVGADGPSEEGPAGVSDSTPRE